MLTDAPSIAVQSAQRRAGLRPRSPHRRSQLTAQLLVFAGATAVVLVYALRGGGSYDKVSFEEHGLLIWWVLAIGFALGLLPRARPPRAVLALWGALAAYAGWTALSLLWTQSSELTTAEVARTLDYLGLAVLVGSVLDRDTWRPAAAGLGFGALIVCVIALGSRLAPSVFGVDHVAAFLHSDRLSYPFGYWNAVAAWGAMCAVLALTWSAHDSSRLRRSVALGVVPVAGAMTYLTYSRAGAGGAAVGVIATVVLSRNRITAIIHTLVAAAGTGLVVLAIRGDPQIAHATGTQRAGSVLGALVFACGLGVLTALLTRRFGVDRRRVPRGIVRPLAAVGAIVLLLAAGAFGPRVVSHAWGSFTKSPTLTASPDPTARLSSLSGSRYSVWKSAVEDFKAHPATGTGAGTFEFWWNQHGTSGEFLRDTHNIWLQNMGELGAPGLILIVAVAAAAVGLAVTVRLRARRSASAGASAAFLGVMIVYLVHASVDWMWESTAVTVLALAGVAAVGGRLSGRSLRLRIPARAALVAVAAGAALLQLPGMLSTIDIRNSQAAERAGDTSSALSAARSAVSAEPWSASAHEQEALVLEVGGRLPQAKRQESLAVEHESNNYAHYLIRSRIETELGDPSAAVVDYGRAYHLRPKASAFVLAPFFRTT